MQGNSQEEIKETLRGVLDPELKRDVVSLGMVKGIAMKEKNVFINLEVVSKDAKVREFFRNEVTKAVRARHAVDKVIVEILLPAASGPGMAPKQSVKGVKQVIAVASGKGGVGKTTASVNLALALKKLGYQVGLMDGDIYGPNVPLMLGVDPAERPKVNHEEKMVPIDAYGIKMISMGVLVPADQPMVWRGPMLHGAVTQFLQKVAWGELDFLLVDLPPGTGDVQLSLVQNISLAGAVIVTTPQEVSLMDVRKGIVMFEKTHVPILGVIENMTGPVFGEGGGRKAAEQFKVPFLGALPLDPAIREGGDAGKPVVIQSPESEISKKFLHAAEKIAQSVSAAV